MGGQVLGCAGQAATHVAQQLRLQRPEERGEGILVAAARPIEHVVIGRRGMVHCSLNVRASTTREKGIRALRMSHTGPHQASFPVIG